MRKKIGKYGLLKKEPNKTERIEAFRQERAKTISLSGPVKLIINGANIVCPICSGPMKKIMPNITNPSMEIFWGCVNFKITGCKGRLKFE